MSDTDGKKTLGLRGGARPGNVKQSFSHGRTKNVVVETKRKRVVVPKQGLLRPLELVKHLVEIQVAALPVSLMQKWIGALRLFRLPSHAKLKNR